MEEPQNSQPTIYAHAAKFGTILGVISIICVILFYVVDFSWLASFKFIFLMLAVGLGMMIYAGINYRNEIGGYIPYGKAYVHGFVLLAVSGLIGTLFNIVLYTIIDPDLAQKMTDTIIENTEAMMRNFGAPDASIEEATDKMRVDMPQQFSVGGLVIGYGKGLISYAIIALITALFVRKNVPVEL